jgi:hypothetical protein
MSTFSIVEFAAIPAYWDNIAIQVAQIPIVTTQTISLPNSTQSYTSNVFSPTTTLIRVCSNTACCFIWGPIGTTVATAYATSIYLPANAVEYFGIRVNELSNATQILAVIATTS